MKIKHIIILGLIVLYASACETKSQAEKDQEEIISYLADNGLEAEKHSSGLYYIIEVEGYSANPSEYANVKVNYKGYLTNNKVFDETTTEPAWLELTRVIEGWRIGIPLLKKGGKGTLFIPSVLAYGSSAKEDIPKNSVLIFEIELLDFDEPF